MAVADVKLIMSIRFLSDSSGVLRGSDSIFPGLLVHVSVGRREYCLRSSWKLERVVEEWKIK